MQDTRETRFLTVFIVLSILIFFLPMLIRGIPVSHDGDYHISWAYFFSGQFWSGDAYPRFLTGISDGFGGPTFFYYAPLPFWMSALLFPLFRTALSMKYLLAVSYVLIFVIGSVGIYLATRDKIGRTAALIAVLAYLSLPYHLLIDAYARGAFGETFATAILPFLFVRFNKKGQRVIADYLVVSLSIAAMMLSHPPSAVVSLIPAFVYHTYLAIRDRDRNGYAVYLLGGLSGLILTAFYLVPAFLVENPALYKLWEHRRILAVRVIGFESKFSIALSFSIIVTALISLAAILITIVRKKRPRAEYLLVIAICLFFMTPLSQPLYRISIIEKIQFPWRFMITATFVVAVQLGIFYKEIIKRTWQKILLVVLLFGLGLLPYPLIIQGHIEPFPDSRIRDLIDTGFNEGAYTLVSPVPADFADTSMLLVTDGPDVEVKSWKENIIVLSGNMVQNQLIRLRRAAFGEWDIVDNESGSHRVSTSSEGLLQVVIGSDTGILTLRQRRIPQVMWGWIISLIGVCLFFGISFRFHSRKYTDILEPT